MYATLGAGPVGRGKLVSDVNRPADVDLSTKTEEVKLDLGGRGENEVVTVYSSRSTKVARFLDTGRFRR